MEARQLTGLSDKEIENLIILCDNFFETWNLNKTLSVVPGFQKKPLQPFAFIARYTDPKGLFQVLHKDATRYFLSLTSQPIRVYREIDEQ
jgi:hypothetical protein